jgi:hypothetical protein
MTFHVLQSYLIRIHFPSDKGLNTGTESLFFKGIGYWNSMGVLTAESQRKCKRKKSLPLFATLRFQHFYRRGAKNTEKKAAVKNP